LDALSLNRVLIDRTGEGRHATITYEKVRLDKLSFWIKRNDQEEECPKVLLRHARVQNITFLLNWRWERSIY